MLGSVIWSGLIGLALAGQDAPPPLSKAMLLDALRLKSFSTEGLVGYIRNCKVDFHPEPETLRELEQAGATREILDAVRESAPQAPAPRVAEFIVPSEVQQARLLEQQPIEQTPKARAAQLELERAHGTVKLQVRIDEDGSVAQVKPLSGHPVLVELATEAVRQWKYRPALQDGQPVRVQTELTLSFSDPALVVQQKLQPALPRPPAGAEVSSGSVYYAFAGDSALLTVTPLLPFDLRQETLKDPDRLVLDFSGEGEVIGGPIPRTVPVADAVVRQIRIGTPKPGTTRVVLELEPGTKATIERASGPDRVVVRLRLAITTSATPGPVQRVVLDAGHGGKDTGATSPGGLLEKDVALDVALRLGQALSNRYGVAVHYTRDSDRYVSLEERARIANAHAPALFLSLHANAEPTRSVTGFDAFIASSESGRVGRHSRAAATYVHAALQMAHPSGARTSVKAAPFVVLAESSAPAALAEIGFLSHPADEAFLNVPANRGRIVEALSQAILTYLKSLEATQMAQRD